MVILRPLFFLSFTLVFLQATSGDAWGMKITEIPNTDCLKYQWSNLNHEVYYSKRCLLKNGSLENLNGKIRTVLNTANHAVLAPAGIENCFLKNSFGKYIDCSDKLLPIDYYVNSFNNNVFKNNAALVLNNKNYTESYTYHQKKNNEFFLNQQTDNQFKKNIQFLKDDTEEKNKKIIELSSKILELDRQINQHSFNEKENSELKNQLHKNLNLKNELETSQSKNKRLEMELQNYKSKEKEFVSQKDKLIDYERKNKSLQFELDKIKQQQTSNKTENKLSKEQEGKIGELIKEQQILQQNYQLIIDGINQKKENLNTQYDLIKNDLKRQLEDHLSRFKEASKNYNDENNTVLNEQKKNINLLNSIADNIKNNYNSEIKNYLTQQNQILDTQKKQKDHIENLIKNHSILQNDHKKINENLLTQQNNLKIQINLYKEQEQKREKQHLKQQNEIQNLLVQFNTHNNKLDLVHEKLSEHVKLVDNNIKTQNTLTDEITQLKTKLDSFLSRKSQNEGQIDTKKLEDFIKEIDKKYKNLAGTLENELKNKFNLYENDEGSIKNDYMKHKYEINFVLERQKNLLSDYTKTIDSIEKNIKNNFNENFYQLNKSNLNLKNEQEKQTKKIDQIISSLEGKKEELNSFIKSNIEQLLVQHSDKINKETKEQLEKHKNELLNEIKNNQSTLIKKQVENQQALVNKIDQINLDLKNNQNLIIDKLQIITNQLDSKYKNLANELHKKLNETLQQHNLEEKNRHSSYDKDHQNIISLQKDQNEKYNEILRQYQQLEENHDFQVKLIEKTLDNKILEITESNQKLNQHNEKELINKINSIKDELVQNQNEINENLKNDLISTVIQHKNEMSTDLVNKLKLEIESINKNINTHYKNLKSDTSQLRKNNENIANNLKQIIEKLEKNSQQKEQNKNLKKEEREKQNQELKNEILNLIKNEISQHINQDKQQNQKDKQIRKNEKTKNQQELRAQLDTIKNLLNNQNNKPDLNQNELIKQLKEVLAQEVKIHTGTINNNIDQIHQKLEPLKQLSDHQEEHHNQVLASIAKMNENILIDLDHLRKESESIKKIIADKEKKSQLKNTSQSQHEIKQLKQQLLEKEKHILFLMNRINHPSLELGNHPKIEKNDISNTHRFCLPIHKKRGDGPNPFIEMIDRRIIDLMH